MKKQLICALLVLVALMSTSAFAFTDDAAIVHKEAVKTCADLGIFKGRDDGRFDPTAAVTRAEMASVLYFIYNGGKATPKPQMQSLYLDIVDHWAKNYILFCYDKGLANGYSVQIFAPDTAVTAAEVSKMMLNLLGYSSQLEIYTGSGWYIMTWQDAQTVGLRKGLENIQRTDFLSREQVAVMIANALQSKTVQYNDELTSVDGKLVVTPNVRSFTDKTLKVQCFGY